MSGFASEAQGGVLVWNGRRYPYAGQSEGGRHLFQRDGEPLCLALEPAELADILTQPNARFDQARPPFQLSFTALVQGGEFGPFIQANNGTDVLHLPGATPGTAVRISVGEVAND